MKAPTSASSFVERRTSARRHYEPLLPEFFPVKLLTRWERHGIFPTSLMREAAARMAAILRC